MRCRVCSTAPSSRLCGRARRTRALSFRAMACLPRGRMAAESLIGRTQSGARKTLCMRMPPSVAWSACGVPHPLAYVRPRARRLWCSRGLTGHAMRRAACFCGAG